MNLTAFARRSPKSFIASWSPWYALDASLVGTMSQSRPTTSYLRRSMQVRATLYRSARLRRVGKVASRTPSLPGGVGRFQPGSNWNLRGSGRLAPGGGASTGTGRIGLNGANAPSVKVLDGLGRNGLYIPR